MFSFWKGRCACKNTYTLVVLKNDKEVQRYHMLVGEEARFFAPHHKKCPRKTTPLNNEIVVGEKDCDHPDLLSAKNVGRAKWVCRECGKDVSVLYVLAYQSHRKKQGKGLVGTKTL
jgi:hypothetical protein